VLLRILPKSGKNLLSKTTHIPTKKSYSHFSPPSTACAISTSQSVFQQSHTILKSPARSKFSVCGVPFPHCETPKQFKSFKVTISHFVKKSENSKKNNEIEPFYFLDFLYKRQKEHAWEFLPDNTSYFGKIAKLNEVHNFTVHGNPLP
jgi:hypothetical protein